MVQWPYTSKSLLDTTEANPYHDSRSHRGILCGGFLTVGYTWTPGRAAALAQNGKPPDAESSLCP